ncbi:hypothetical protein AAU01_11110 [Paenarthrobacter aurescens]|uniref:Uncharacterized protein n=1 Tax=Paenarthrobacter aurescens TaxID=43663 RepID=A0A4Y3NGU2_PAEAU|nr:hypothetical protein AAU01_11110 [Paenarthrobacter aurescens]
MGVGLGSDDAEGTADAVGEGVVVPEHPAISSISAAAAGYKVRMMTSTSMVVRTRFPVNAFARESGIDTATKNRCANVEGPVPQIKAFNDGWF